MIIVGRPISFLSHQGIANVPLGHPGINIAMIPTEITIITPVTRPGTGARHMFILPVLILHFPSVIPAADFLLL